ncbi:MAG: small, acid-soluble spore protein, alpha/beta type [Caldicoprobacterales bacterium]|jgi:small acid-soluble spore protein A (major alpha-type SASP)|nr:alpha/beta-type small acid-soluble spore protein [Clostridiales bacterium]
MAAGSKNTGKNRQLVKGAHKALDDMKYEIARELNLPVQQGSEDYWGDLTSADCGRVGGNMLRRLVAMAEDSLAKGNRG